MILSDSQLRAERADSREAALIAVMATYGITLPRNAPDWRVPAEPASGTITGIAAGQVHLLCTDGVVGWFRRDDDSLLFGHLQHFDTAKPRAVYARKAPKKTDEEKLLDAAKKLLAMLGV